MSPRELTAEETRLPRFAPVKSDSAEAFDLDSHARARDALDFGLRINGIGFNIFVIGEDRTGRLTATVAYLNEALTRYPRPPDWVYLNNFRHPERPTPHPLPAGMGRRFRDRMAALVAALREALAAGFASDAYQAQAQALHQAAQQEIGANLGRLHETARAHGMELARGPDGKIGLVPVEGGEPPTGDTGDIRATLAVALAHSQREAVAIQTRLAAKMDEISRALAGEIGDPLLEAVTGEFSGFGGLARWLTEMRVDIMENPGRFAPAENDSTNSSIETPERRYAVNLLVDHGDSAHPVVVIESTPSYENLFGRIDYRQVQGTVQTDFTLIRAGALHRANGGVLVLRAEALGADPVAWRFLKAALRDREIRIETPGRESSPRIAGAPDPRAVPLNLKLVLIGAPRWYAQFFLGDPDFQTYFKIKAEIDPDTAASPHNLGIYGALIARLAAANGTARVTDGAVARLLGMASRWAGDRTRLTAKFELIEDIIVECAGHAQGRHSHGMESGVLTEAVVDTALDARRRRNAAPQERVLREIGLGTIMIDTSGGAIGQVNALVIHETGDYRFGSPVRVTARASAGRAGIINIERDVALAGPIQQKASMVLQGVLAAAFAQTRPLSFTASVTFEQSYGEIEGDSASLAVLVAILSDLAQLPVRQDIAITGSVNQAGFAQAIGGAHWKIEGFFRACEAKPGGLTGTQGVIVPDANRHNLVLNDEVAAAIAGGRFHVWSVTTIQEAAEILLGAPAGAIVAAGHAPPDTIFGRVARRLDAFDEILAKRREGRVDGG